MSTSKSKPESVTDWSLTAREEIEKLHRSEVDDLKETIKQYSDQLSAVKFQRDAALAIEARVPKITPIVASGTSDSEATAFAIAGDWHFEEQVTAASVNGMNEFSVAIAEKRIDKFFNSVLRLTEIERVGTKIDTLVLVLLGDLLSGRIHEELCETTAMSPTQAVIWLRDKLLSGIETLKKRGKFSRIIVPCCYGNHSRTTRKPRYSTGPANSYEWLLYQVCAKHMPDVEWHIAESYHTYLDVYGKTVRLHHGDGLRYEGGIGGLTIPVEKAIASWNKGRVADLDIFGHWHTQQQNPKWICNGSLIGYNAFSIGIKAPFEPPQQTYFLFDSKRGRTGTWPIFLS